MREKNVRHHRKRNQESKVPKSTHCKAQKTKLQNAYKADRVAKHAHKRQSAHAQEVKHEHKTLRKGRKREEKRKAKHTTQETKHK